jgi:hypothetical protein
MQPLKGHVKNGRIVLDEPAELPEGAVVYVVRGELDDMDEAERAELNDAIRESIEQMNNGQLIDGDEALARLRAIR